MQLEHRVKLPTGSRQPIPVLFLHGAWHAAWAYDLWLDDFAAHGYEAHAMSLPAHGKSEKTKALNLYSVQEYVGALDEIVSQVKPPPFIIAHSMGGCVLQQYLKTHTPPAAVLLCSVPVFGSLPAFIRFFLHHPLNYLLSFATLNMGRVVTTPAFAAEFFLTENPAISPQQLASQLQSEALWALLQSGLFLRGDPTRVHSPLLVVAAERDVIFPVGEEKRTARAYHADFMLIEGQAHDLMVERDWQKTAAQIRGWLAKYQPQ